MQTFRNLLNRVDYLTPNNVFSLIGIGIVVLFCVAFYMYYETQIKKTVSSLFKKAIYLTSLF